MVWSDREQKRVARIPAVRSVNFWGQVKQTPFVRCLPNAGQHCWWNISKFNCQAICLTVWPRPQTLLVNNFLLTATFSKTQRQKFCLILLVRLSNIACQTFHLLFSDSKNLQHFCTKQLFLATRRSSLRINNNFVVQKSWIAMLLTWPNGQKRLARAVCHGFAMPKNSNGKYA